PTSPEWEWMAGGGSRRYPWGDEEPNAQGQGKALVAARANLRGIGPGRPTPVGAFPAGATPYGLWDVAGNVWEWTSTPVPGVRRASPHRAPLHAACRHYARGAPAAIIPPGSGGGVGRDR